MDYFNTVLEDLGVAASKAEWGKINSYIDSSCLDDSHGLLSRLLLLCCYYGGESSVRKLILMGADVNYIDSGGISALENTIGGAAKYQTLDTLKVLLEFGGNPNLQCHVDKCTPLQLAIIANHIDHMKLLLEFGANPKLKTIDGENSFDFARKYKNHKAAEVLGAYS